jgi:hypothetical protein
MGWLRSWKRRVLVALILALAAVLAVGIVWGKGDSSSSGASARGTEDANGRGSFVGRAGNAVMFVQWTRVGDSVTGSLREAITKTRAGSGVTSDDHAFTGVIHGSGLTLNLGGLESTAYVGEVRSDGFSLTLPGKGDALITVEFAPGEVAAYDEATKQLLLGEYSTPCTLYVVGSEARAAFTGANASESCATLVARQPSVEWTTEQQAATGGQPVACELVNRANEQVVITDEGGQYYGRRTCQHLSSEGWG